MQGLYEIFAENSQIGQNGDSLFTAVYEYYAGRSKELIKCEGYLNNIVAKIGYGEKDFDLSKTPISRNDPDHKALERELAKFFKVKEVRIYWEGGQVNAYTLCNSKLSAMNASNALKNGKDSNISILTFMYWNTISTCGLTGAEVLAVLLHEIGHNFYWCPLSLFNEIFITIMNLGLPVLIKMFAKGIYTIKGEVKDWIRVNLPAVQNIADMVSRVNVEFGLMSKPFNILKKVGDLILNPSKIIYTIANADLTKYGGEKGADSFAAKYGYGPELSSALRKMKGAQNSLYGAAISGTGAIGNVLADITELQIDITNMILLEPHPNNNQRAAAMLNKLEKDLQKGDYSPEAKKELEAEVKRMRKAYEEATLITESEDGPNIRKGIYTMLDGLTNGHSDLREIFNFYYDAYRF